MRRIAQLQIEEAVGWIRKRTQDGDAQSGVGCAGWNSECAISGDIVASGVGGAINGREIHRNRITAGPREVEFEVEVRLTRQRHPRKSIKGEQARFRIVVQDAGDPRAVSGESIRDRENGEGKRF